MDQEIKYEWDGETIKQNINVPEKKITPMEMLNHIDRLKGEISQMENQQNQYKNALANLDKALAESKKTLKQWAEYEPKCEELQIAKLKMLFESVKNECMDRAIADTKKEVEQNPAEMTEETIENSKYVKFRHLVGTNEKIRNKVAQRIITKHLYEEPFFDNPFKV